MELYVSTAINTVNIANGIKKLKPTLTCNIIESFCTSILTHEFQVVVTQK